MNPTLKPLDILQVIPYQGQEIQPGDVIVFLPPEGERTVIHRVVGVDWHGIRTRGDNCSSFDPWFLTSDNIIGRVSYVRRGNRRFRMYGGATGRLFALVVRVIRIIDSGMCTPLRPLYHWLVRTGAFRRWLPTRVKIRVFSFDRSGGTELRLFMGQRMVGRLSPGSNHWIIRRPFRLFVNEACLPRP